MEETNEAFELQSDDLMTFEEVAAYLKVSVQTVRDYVAYKENPLPVSYLSRQNPRVFKSELTKWVRSRTKPVEVEGEDGTDTD